MNKKITCAFLSLSFFFVSVISAQSASLQKKNLPLSNILQDLNKQGYISIGKVDYKDNLYQIHTWDHKAQQVTIWVDPFSGKVIRPKPTKPLLTLIDVADRLEKKGYHTIYTIQFENNKYVVNALDKNDKKVALDVNAQTGEIGVVVFF